MIHNNKVCENRSPVRFIRANSRSTNSVYLNAIRKDFGRGEFRKGPPRQTQIDRGNGGHQNYVQRKDHGVRTTQYSHQINSYSKINITS